MRIGSVLAIVVIMFAAAFGILYSSGYFRKKSIEAQFDKAFENAEPILPKSEDAPLWGNVSLLGSFVLYERNGGEQAMSILYADQNRAPAIPTVLLEGRELDKSRIRVEAGSKYVVGGLYKTLNEQGFFSTEQRFVEPFTTVYRELAVVGTGRLFRIQEAGMGSADFQKAIASFTSSYEQAAAEARGAPATRPTPPRKP